MLTEKKYNLIVKILLSNGSINEYGAMSLRDVRGFIMMEKANYIPLKIDVCYALIKPETERGKELLKGKDFAIMTTDNHIDYLNMDDPIPMYSF